MILHILSDSIEQLLLTVRSFNTRSRCVCGYWICITKSYFQKYINLLVIKLFYLDYSILQSVKFHSIHYYHNAQECYVMVSQPIILYQQILTSSQSSLLYWLTADKFDNELWAGLWMGLSDCKPRYCRQMVNTLELINNCILIILKFTYSLGQKNATYFYCIHSYQTGSYTMMQLIQRNIQA